MSPRPSPSPADPRGRKPWPVSAMTMLSMYWDIARELDRNAAALGKQLGGSVSSRRWAQAGGLDARSYAISYGDKVEEITFALDGRREYQLLCRRAAAGDDAACAELLRSFQTD